MMTHTYAVRLRDGRMIEVSAPTMPVVRDGALEVTAEGGRTVARLDGAEVVAGKVRLDGVAVRLAGADRRRALVDGPDAVTFANDHELELVRAAPYEVEPVPQT